MKRLRVALVLWAAALLWTANATAQPAAPRSAPLLTVYQGPGCTGRDRVAGFESWLGRPVDKVLDFLAEVSWSQLEATANWVSRCWQAWPDRLVISVPLLPRDGQSSLAAGARGEYDEHFRRVGESLVKQGLGGAILRPGWEFNANWYPWSSLKEPQQYAAAFRRFVGVMRAVPGAKFRFDWCVALRVDAPSPEAAYPGDDVVDLIGADVYNSNYFPSGFTAQQRWQRLLDAPYGLRWHQRFAAAHGKPMSFPEWGTGTRPDGHGGGDDPVFMAGMIAWIRANPVEYHGYWDYRARDYDAKLSDGRQPVAAALFLEAFGGGRR